MVFASCCYCRALHYHGIPLPRRMRHRAFSSEFFSDSSTIWDTCQHHAMTASQHISSMPPLTSFISSMCDRSIAGLCSISSDSITHMSDTSSVSHLNPTSTLHIAASNTISDNLTVELEEKSLSALGHDILLFLAAAVVVDPLGKILGVTPVL